MTRFVIASLAVVFSVGPSVVDAAPRSRQHCAPRVTYSAVPAAPQTAAANGQYQSFSYEPGVASSTPVAAPVYRIAPAYRMQSTPSSVPPYLRPGYKALGQYGH